MATYSTEKCRSGFKIACVIMLFQAVQSFHTYKNTGQIHTRRSFRSPVATIITRCQPEEDDDPYGDIFDFKKTIEVEEAPELFNVWSIDSKIDSGSLAKTRMTPKTAQEQWEHWDEFMEQEFGNMDAEITEDQKWMIDMRDMVEQKRGFAIWSKKSDKELQRELKKALEKKALNVPESVAMIIRAVYLEKSHTMKKMRKDHELACIGFRKWVIEQRKKTKKDPLPLARIEVSKKWLDMHPNTSKGYSSSKTKAPPVIMDDCTIPVYGVAFGSSKGSGGASTSTVPNRIVTASMLNWEKRKEEIPQKQIETVKSKVVKTTGESFFIDDEEMYIASRANSNVDEEYYVVL